MLNWLKKYRLTILAFLILFMLPFAVVLAKGYSTIRDFERERPLERVTILDRHGETIGVLGESGRFVPLDQIPDALKNAVISVEDKRFYSHYGFDIIGIFRSLFANIRAGKIVQGSSTITQQLAKNMFLHPRKVLARKFEELALSILLETRFTKDEILEMYLNSTYFGEGAWGVENAARTFFGKSVTELTLGESALIAGLPQAPSAYSPFQNLERALKRREIVLDSMVEAKKLDAATAERVKNEPVQLQEATGGVGRYFIDWVTNILIRELGESSVFSRGIRVHTTLDLEMQRIAEKVFTKQDNQGALVAIEPKNGYIVALVGGRNYKESQFNRAVMARRQPGSAFKPILYAAAIKDRWQQNTLVEDIPREYSGYKPENYQDAYWGPVTMKFAITLSLNNAAVWTLNELGLNKMFNFAKQLEIPLVNEDRNLALALGGLTEGVSPLQLTSAFVPFANGGVFYSPNPIIRVVDIDGNILIDNEPKGKDVLTPQQAYLITDMLQAVMTDGTGKRIPVEQPVAGKTGTTNGNVDLWFVGYTPDIVVGVYIGNDDRKPVEGFGGTVAGPIFADFVNQAIKEPSVEEFPVPENIVTDIQIDIFTGFLATDRCEYTELESFIKGTEPTRWADCARPQVNRTIPKLTPEQNPPPIEPTPELPEEEVVPEEPFEEEQPIQPEEPVEPEPEPTPEPIEPEPIQPIEPEPQPEPSPPTEEPGPVPIEPEPQPTEPETPVEPVQPSPTEPEPEQPFQPEPAVSEEELEQNPNQ